MSLLCLSLLQTPPNFKSASVAVGQGGPTKLRNAGRIRAGETEDGFLVSGSLGHDSGVFQGQGQGQGQAVREGMFTDVSTECEELGSVFAKRFWLLFVTGSFEDVLLKSLHMRF